MAPMTKEFPLSHFREIWMSSGTDFTLAVIITLFGLVLMLVYLFNRKHSGLYILYGGLFTFLYGIRILTVNDMIFLLDAFPPLFLRYITAIITYFIGVYSTLVFMTFIGWGWKRSLLWLLAIQITYGVVASVVDILMNSPFYAEYPANSILVFSGVILMFANIVLSRKKFAGDFSFLGIGLGIFLLAVINDNMIEINLLPWSFKMEWPAFFILICSISYVILKKSIKTERDLIRVNRDMENARNILLASLPKSVPKSMAYSVAVSYNPMDLVGGDFYDFHTLENNCLGVVVADVSGHGLPAALIASMLKVAFLSQREKASSPAKLLEGMNKILCNQLNDEFITLAYIHLDPLVKIISYSTAGHPPMLLYQHKTRQVKELRCPGVPVGISPETIFSMEETEIEQGDRLVIYTDGITEASDNHGMLYGSKQLISCLEEHSSETLENLCHSINESVIAWQDSRRKKDPEDDMTVIVLDIL